MASQYQPTLSSFSQNKMVSHEQAAYWKNEGMKHKSNEKLDAQM